MNRTTAIDRVKESLTAETTVARLKRVGIIEPKAISVAAAADLRITCLEAQIQSLRVQLDIARRVQARRGA